MTFLYPVIPIELQSGSNSHSSSPLSMSQHSGSSSTGRYAEFSERALDEARDAILLEQMLAKTPLSTSVPLSSVNMKLNMSSRRGEGSTSVHPYQMGVSYAPASTATEYSSHDSSANKLYGKREAAARFMGTRSEISLHSSPDALITSSTSMQQRLNEYESALATTRVYTRPGDSMPGPVDPPAPSSRPSVPLSVLHARSAAARQQQEQSAWRSSILVQTHPSFTEQNNLKYNATTVSHVEQGKGHASAATATSSSSSSTLTLPPATGFNSKVGPGTYTPPMSAPPAAILASSRRGLRPGATIDVAAAVPRIAATSSVDAAFSAELDSAIRPHSRSALFGSANLAHGADGGLTLAEAGAGGGGGRANSNAARAAIREEQNRAERARIRQRQKLAEAAAAASSQSRKAQEDARRNQLTVPAADVLPKDVVLKAWSAADISRVISQQQEQRHAASSSSASPSSSSASSNSTKSAIGASSTSTDVKQRGLGLPVIAIAAGFAVSSGGSSTQQLTSPSSSSATSYASGNGTEASQPFSQRLVPANVFSSSSGRAPMPSSQSSSSTLSQQQQQHKPPSRQSTVRSDSAILDDVLGASAPLTVATEFLKESLPHAPSFSRSVRFSSAAAGSSAGGGAGGGAVAIPGPGAYRPAETAVAPHVPAALFSTKLRIGSVLQGKPSSMTTAELAANARANEALRAVVGATGGGFPGGGGAGAAGGGLAAALNATKTGPGSYYSVTNEYMTGTVKAHQFGRSSRFADGMSGSIVDGAGSAGGMGSGIVHGSRPFEAILLANARRRKQLEEAAKLVSTVARQEEALREVQENLSSEQDMNSVDLLRGAGGSPRTRKDWSEEWDRRLSEWDKETQRAKRMEAQRLRLALEEKERLRAQAKDASKAELERQADREEARKQAREDRRVAAARRKAREEAQHAESLAERAELKAQAVERAMERAAKLAESGSPTAQASVVNYLSPSTSAAAVTGAGANGQQSNDCADPLTSHTQKEGFAVSSDSLTRVLSSSGARRGRIAPSPNSPSTHRMSSRSPTRAMPTSTSTSTADGAAGAGSARAQPPRRKKSGRVAKHDDSESSSSFAIRCRVSDAGDGDINGDSVVAAAHFHGEDDDHDDEETDANASDSSRRRGGEPIAVTLEAKAQALAAKVRQGQVLLQRMGGVGSKTSAQRVRKQIDEAREGALGKRERVQSRMTDLHERALMTRLEASEARRLGPDFGLHETMRQAAMAAAALRLVYVGLAAQRIGSMVGYLRAHPRRTFGQIEKARVVIARFLLWVVKRKREERRRRAAPVIYAACRRFMLVSRRAKRARAVPVILATLLDAQQKSLVLARMKWVRNMAIRIQRWWRRRRSRTLLRVEMVERQWITEEERIITTFKTAEAKKALERARKKGLVAAGANNKVDDAAARARMLETVKVYTISKELRREQILAAVSEQRSAWRSAVRDYMYKLVSWRKLSTLRAAIARSVPVAAVHPDSANEPPAVTLDQVNRYLSDSNTAATGQSLPGLLSFPVTSVPSAASMSQSASTSTSTSTSLSTPSSPSSSSNPFELSAETLYSMLNALPPPPRWPYLPLVMPLTALYALFLDTFGKVQPRPPAAYRTRLAAHMTSLLRKRLLQAHLVQNSLSLSLGASAGGDRSDRERLMPAYFSMLTSASSSSADANGGSTPSPMWRGSAPSASSSSSSSAPDAASNSSFVL